MNRNKPYFFKDITSELSEGVIIIDELGAIQSINVAVTDLFGYLEDDLIGRNIKCLMSESYSCEYDSYITNHLKTDVSKVLDYGREVKGRRKDGIEFPLNLKLRRVDLDGKAFFFGVIHNLTDRDAANKTIRHQTELLTRAEKIAKLGHWRLDLQSSELFWSEEVYRIHGVTPSKFAPSLDTAVNFYHPADVPMVEASLAKSMSEKTDFTFDARLIRPDGEIVHVRSSGECSIDAEGNVTALFGIFQDITDLKTSQKLLEEQNKFLSLIMSSAPDVMFVKDRDFKIVEANPAFLALYPPEMRDNVIGTTSTEGFDPDEAEAFLKQDKIAFATGKSEVEETIVFPDGLTRTLLTKKVRFYSHGEPFILGLAREITKMKATQRELEQANAELQEFSYRTSHDLRSPLLSSIGLLEIAKQELPIEVSDTVIECLDMAEQSLVELKTFVGDLLQLTRAQIHEEEFCEVNIADEVDRAIKKMAHLSSSNQIDIHVDVDAADTFTTQTDKFRQILENLISNAIKYHDPSEAQPCIRIHSRFEAQQLSILVEDNGLGIPKGKENKPFEMFTRLHSNVSYGTGLGLYMVKQSVARMGGTVELVNSPKGATFQVLLPIRKESLAYVV